MGNAVGEGRERERVGPQIHLALSVADRERRPFPRSDQQILLALEQVDERKGASQALERCVHSLLRRLAGREFLLDHEGRHLGVCLGRKHAVVYRELSAQRLEVLDEIMPLWTTASPRAACG